MPNRTRALVALGVLAALLFSAPAVSAAPAPWAPNVAYHIGDQVTYGSGTYQCIQAHTSLTGWEPPNVPALWTPIAANTPTKTSNAPVNTATRTPTRTSTPSGLTSTSLAPTLTRTRTPSPTPTSGTGGGCWAAWVSTSAYVGGGQVSRSNQNYQAAYWTQGDDPATHSGPAGSGQPWIPMGACGAGNPTATRTNTPGGPSRTPTATFNGAGFPSTVFSVYADISFTSVQSAYQASGQKYYALSFILGNAGACVPAWDGTHLMPENYYASQVSAIRAGGGDVSAVFGGANGSDMASVCTSTGSLQAAYQAVVNQYQFKWIDLNVEGGMVADSVSVDRRNKAVAGLEAANPNLRVSYTLPVTQSGLLQTALDLLSNAKANGVRIDYVNVMTMNYGPAGIDMGQAAIDAATNTRNQLAALGIPARIGVTAMIGQNNTYGEIFDLGDADQLVAFARANSFIGWLSFWSLGRDNGGCAGNTTASASCSGISQGSYDFTNKFKTFP